MKIQCFSKSMMLAAAFSLLTAGTLKAQTAFDAPRNFLSGDGVLSIVSEDFNRDGLQDFATSNKKTDTLSVHLNLGGGTFSEPWAEYPVGPFAPPLPKSDPSALPIGIASGDFNHDGAPDLVTSNSESDTVSVLLNNGDGTFGTARDFTVRMDGLSPRPGNPDGYQLLNPESVTTGDFNGDGILDIATANIRGSRISILIGDGLGRFAAPMQFFVGAQPISIIAGDFNNDGTVDIATVNNGPAIVRLRAGSPLRTTLYTVSVLENLGDGSVFNEVRYQVGHNPVHLIAADLDGNGWLDLLTANHSVVGGNPAYVSWVSVLMNDGTGLFEPELQVPTDQFPNAVAAADLNGDRRMDIVSVHNYTPGTFSISVQNPDGSYAPFETFSPGVMNAPNFVVADDFDSDGDPDLLASSKNSDDFSLLLNQAVANAAAPATLPPTGGDPDLTVVITKLKSGFKKGETRLEVQVEVANIGGGPAVGWSRVTLAVGGQTLHTWNILDGVQAGGSVVLKCKLTLPMPVSGQMLSILADADHFIPESNEANNTATQIMD